MTLQPAPTLVVAGGPAAVLDVEKFSCPATGWNKRRASWSDFLWMKGCQTHLSVHKGFGQTERGTTAMPLNVRCLPAGPGQQTAPIGWSQTGEGTPWGPPAGRRYATVTSVGSLSTPQNFSKYEWQQNPPPGFKRFFPTAEIHYMQIAPLAVGTFSDVIFCFSQMGA